MIGLAILFVLTVAMFLYFRQKMAYYEVRLSLLSDTVQTMAGITKSSLQSDSESEDSESESESESEQNYEPEPIEIEPQVKLESVIKLEPQVINLYEPDLTEPELIVVSDDDTKKIELPTEFDNFTVKELKEKVAELNGPKLKTKKELIQFLSNNI